MNYQAMSSSSANHSAVFCDQSQRCISLSSSNHGISPNDSVHDSQTVVDPSHNTHTRAHTYALHPPSLTYHLKPNNPNSES